MDAEMLLRLRNAQRKYIYGDLNLHLIEITIVTLNLLRILEEACNIVAAMTG